MSLLTILSYFYYNLDAYGYGWAEFAYGLGAFAQGWIGDPLSYIGLGLG